MWISFGDAFACADFMIYFGLPALVQDFGISFNLDRLVAAVMALSLNSAAYIAEIVRAGLQSIEPGQAEAAQSLGLGSANNALCDFSSSFAAYAPTAGQ
jgi:ABC-type amino acid transport system permease subunit